MKIVIIGAGNIATHYAKIFHSLGHEILQVYNRSSANAQALADTVSSRAISNINQISSTAELYIIAVSDSAIPTIVDHLKDDIQGIVIHTSGATSIDVLRKFKRHGVIYPPQSLNKNIDATYLNIPFAVEGSNLHIEENLLTLTKTISPKSFLCSSKQRLALHVSAVFANNFTNALYDAANQILENENLNLDLIRPIILETAQKVQNALPNAVQTGPAVRNDKKTIKSHLEFLSNSKDLSEIYQILNDFIVKSRHK